MQEFINEQEVEVHPSTKLFKGIEKRFEAEQFATNNKSYHFPVFLRKTISKQNKRETTFYGFGVPK